MFPLQQKPKWPIGILVSAAIDQEIFLKNKKNRGQMQTLRIPNIGFRVTGCNENREILFKNIDKSLMLKPRYIKKLLKVSTWQKSRVPI